MISLTVLFWVFIILFAIIGAMRGWSKELLVTFSVILALFLIEVLETYLSFYKKAARLYSGFVRLLWFYWPSSDTRLRTSGRWQVLASPESASRILYSAL
jgi:hypothetical protein